MVYEKFNKLSALAALALVASPLAAAPMMGNSASTECPSASSLQKLMSQLDKSHQDALKGMDCEGQSLAVQLAEQVCKGENTCKGLNSCKAEDHTCKGEGSCKGTSKGPFDNKNDAVDVAKKHMQEKRMDSMGQ